MKHAERWSIAEYGRRWRRARQIDFHLLLFRVTETDAEVEARIAKWDKYLEDGEAEKRQEAADNENRKEQKGEERSVVAEKAELSETTIKDSEKTGTAQQTNVTERSKTLETTSETEISASSEDLEHLGESHKNNA